MRFDMYRYRKRVTIHYHTKYEYVGIETSEYRAAIFIYWI